MDANNGNKIGGFCPGRHPLHRSEASRSSGLHCGTKRRIAPSYNRAEIGLQVHKGIGY